MARRLIVTGVAGFIGSHVADALLAAGDEVVGIDCFTPYYDPSTKRANVPAGVELVEADLRSDPLEAVLDGADAVFHLAAQPGVRLSWSSGFADYVGHNILATQRLLEAATAVGGPRLVYASSSSVYGQASAYPTREVDLPAPHSPYGVTKLAGEHLCGLYAANRGTPTVALRFFTVYGPRQRPDMAMYRLLRAGLTGGRFPLYGDGAAVRDFTAVADVAAATVAAADADLAPGTVLNVAGGSQTSMADLVALAGEVLGAAIAVDRQPAQAGDVTRTGGAIDEAARLLGWAPSVGLRDGVASQAAWLRAQIERQSSGTTTSSAA